MITAHDIFSAFSSNWMTSAQVQRYIDVPVPYGHCFLTLISYNTIMFSCEREFDLDLKHLYLTYVDDRYVVSSDTSDDEYLDDFDGYADIPANILYSFRQFCSDYELTEK